MSTVGEETGAKAPTGRFARVCAAVRRGLPGAFGRGRVIALVALVLLVGLRVQDPEAVQLTRYATLDAFQKLSPREPENTRIAIVDIDEASIAELGQWPWSRADLARMVDAMAAGDPRAIGFDVVFSEPDRLSPELLAGTLDGLPPIARGLLSQLPSTDARFAESIARAPVVLGMSGLAAPELAAGAIATTGAPATPLRAFGGDPTFQLFAFPGQLRNVPTLEAAATGIGMFSLTPEHDGVVRRVPAALRIGETAYPSLAVEMLRLGAGAGSFGQDTSSAQW